MSGGNHAWRCGNCFQGMSGTQVAGLEKMQAELDVNAAARERIRAKYLEEK
jgi:hypothetical protein